MLCIDFAPALHFVNVRAQRYKCQARPGLCAQPLEKRQRQCFCECRGTDTGPCGFMYRLGTRTLLPMTASKPCEVREVAVCWDLRVLRPRADTPDAYVPIYSASADLCLPYRTTTSATS